MPRPALFPVLALALALAALAAPPARAAADPPPCRIALVLALDVSGSVNDAEYAQQLGGLAHALNSPPVRALILSGTGAEVHLAAFEWSSRNHQFLVQPWTVLDSHAAIDRAVARIAGYRRQRAGLKTALGTALAFGGRLLAERGHCWKRTIDVSGDGRNNIGPPPALIHASPGFAGITVNALAVGDPAPEGGAESGPRHGKESAAERRARLRRYFETEVIHGPGAFALIAHGYGDFARAMQAKLLRELALPVLGALAR